MARTATIHGEPVIVGDRVDRVETYEDDRGSALSWIIPLVLAALIATWLFNTFARDNAAVAPANDRSNAETYNPAPVVDPNTGVTPGGSNNAGSNGTI